jgi:hypothetical protein
LTTKGEIALWTKKTKPIPNGHLNGLKVWANRSNSNKTAVSMRPLVAFAQYFHQPSPDISWGDVATHSITVLEKTACPSIKGECPLFSNILIDDFLMPFFNSILASIGVLGIKFTHANQCSVM